MAVRGIDANIMIQKAPEVAKSSSEQTNRQEVFQKNLMNQTKLKAEKLQEQVVGTSKSYKGEVTKDKQSGGKNNKNKDKTKAVSKSSKTEKKVDTEDGLYVKGAHIDIQI